MAPVASEEWQVALPAVAVPAAAVPAAVVVVAADLAEALVALPAVVSVRAQTASTP